MTSTRRMVCGGERAMSTWRSTGCRTDDQRKYVWTHLTGTCAALTTKR